ncbi:hypothetical protein RJD24_07940 [Bacillaceae bacterium IKA-2]|nr:hypothetical protein RJD24_07940 [Bacillaceae bacterium IKA-2]
MDKKIKKSNLLLTFLMGVSITLLVLPLLNALGVPTFDIVLVALFGEENIWGIIFSLFLVLIIVFWLVKVVKKNA